MTILEICILALLMIAMFIILEMNRDQFSQLVEIADRSADLLEKTIDENRELRFEIIRLKEELKEKDHE